ncbi:hypothetical protein CHS0354_004008 [Potamilus streckersoni]|uniref:Chitin-binding type-2 domain-containing protein n=1 Tax=Potamilus streckersoni TaxID=2493646 RepID=A0AAE0VLW1_9BIVA|nr:hypothetical protein CHS0354_004008 [Potamilus streckersoni]
MMGRGKICAAILLVILLKLDNCLSDYPVSRPACLIPFSTCKKNEVGNYQSCMGCDHFIQCTSFGKMYMQKCSPGTFWDDSHRVCTYNSYTCSLPGCAICAAGMTDGPHQACAHLGCNRFVMCFLGRTYIMECPKELEWDERVPGCVRHSTTCVASKHRLLAQFK